VRAEIEQSIRDVRSHGFSAASWQPDVAAIAAPVRTPEADVANIGVATGESVESLIRGHAQRSLEIPRVFPDRR